MFICGTAILSASAWERDPGRGGFASATLGGMAAGAAEGGAAAALAKAQAAAKAALSARRAAVAQIAASRVAGQGYHSFSAFKRAQVAAGPGMHWHHIVEQTPANVQKFGAEAIHNTANLVRVEAGVHTKISGFYSSKLFETSGGRVRDWLSTQTFDEQFEFGQTVLSSVWRRWITVDAAQRMTHELVATYCEAAAARGSALERGSSDVANRYFDQCVEVYRELRRRDALGELLPLLDYEDDHVVLAVASVLLDAFPHDASRAIDQLTTAPGTVGLLAQMAAREWRPGRMRLPD